MVFGVRLDVPEKMAPRDRQDLLDLLGRRDLRDLRVPQEPLQHPLLFHRMRSPLLNAAIRQMVRRKSK
jgi:hypothetical protein